MSAVDLLTKNPESYLTSDPNSEFGLSFGVFSDEVDEVKTVIESIPNVLDYSSQSGKNLDFIGSNLNQKRNGMDDFTYKIFLAIANKKRESKGDIFSMNEIGSQILAGTGTLYEIKELCYDNTPRYLDGTWTLNGDVALSGSYKQPATIQVVFSGDVNSVIVAPEFNKAIDQIRGGGIQAIISYRFEILFANMPEYNIPNGILDGSWILDGTIILSGTSIKLIPGFIAIGDGAFLSGGAIRSPQPGDTGLQNEVLRKSCEVVQTGPNSREFRMKVKQGEAIGSQINEIGLFGFSGQLLALYSFPAKAKDSIITYEFVIKEEN